MPMIPKPMTDINSESAYEKLKFIPEHYNEIMAAYTDIMEHLKLPVMTDTGGGGSGEECLHEVTEVINPCPAYIQFDFNANIPLTGIYFAYKDNYGDYNVQSIYEWDNDGIAVGLRRIISKYNQIYGGTNAISMTHHNYLHEYPMLPLPSDSSLVYAAVLVDKTTSELVENVDKYTDIDGISSSDTTYDDLANAYDVKLALVDPNNYSFAPVILGDLFEQLVELRAGMNADVYTANLPTPEELLRLLQVECDEYSFRGKLNISLVTAEERARVRNNLQMSTSDSIPEDNGYMYAINLFCHPNTLNTYHTVKYSCIGSYSKGFIFFGSSDAFGLTGGGCDDYTSITYKHITITLTPASYSDSYVYYTAENTYEGYDKLSGVTVTPYTFKLIQSKEGIDRRL